jgi:hypothetical protein
MILYKYYAASRTDVFKTWLVRFTPPAVFNDPFEMLPHVSSFTTDDHVLKTFEATFEKIAVESYHELPEHLKQTYTLAQYRETALADKSTICAGVMADAMQSTPVLSSTLLRQLGGILGILCLSEKPDNPLMWAHYASSHTGFAVGFDPEHSFFHQRRNDDDQFGYLRKVRYSHNRPSVVVHG